jgi:GT2 family glycosyltransferase
MPAFNEQSYLEDAVQSVLKQTERDIELIIVDDGSSDSTWEMIWRLRESDHRITALWKPNGGTGSALNMGFHYARGRYQTWFSADNIMVSDALEQLALALDLNTEAVLAYGDFNMQEEGSGKITMQRCREYDFDALRRQCYIGNAWLFRADVKRRAGEYSQEVCEDYDMHLRMAQLGPFIRVPRTLGVWRSHAENLTNRVCRLDGWQAAVRAQARAHWKNGSVKVLHVSLSGTQAYPGWHLLQAVSQMSQRCSMRRVTTSTSERNPGCDLVLPKDATELSRIAPDANVLHLNVDTSLLNEQGREIEAWAELGIPIVLHLHGVLCERGLQTLYSLMGLWTGQILCSVPHTSRIVPDGKWMPELHPIDQTSALFDTPLFSIPSDRSAPSDLIICDPVSEATVTKMLELRDLAGFGGGVSRMSIHNRPLPYREHLQRQQRANALLSSRNGGYFGQSEWEALAQGLAVLGRLDDTAREIYAEVGEGTIPPYIDITNESELRMSVDRLASCPDDVLALGREARAWMNRYLSVARVLQLYENVYLEAARSPNLQDFRLKTEVSGLPAHTPQPAR